jgi:murein DD-endopeptidase MepM/ murein hydrolase activator NlpD
MPQQFSPYKPIFPLVQNTSNPWGKHDPDNYHQFGFDDHNGADYAMGQDKLVRAPFAGTIIRVGNQPTGGGIFCSLLSDDIYQFAAFSSQTSDGRTIQFPASQTRVLFDFLHLESVSATEGTHYVVGDILAVQDNTGFSTGPHTHIQARRVTPHDAPPGTPPAYRYLNNQILQDFDLNTANNSFDPQLFWNIQYASVVKNVTETIAAGQVQMQKIAAAPIPVQAKLSFLDQLKAAYTNLKKFFQN